LTLQTGESKTLLEAVRLYVDSFKSKDNQEGVHRELHKFIQWCGPDRTFSEISPAEIGEYADQVGGTGTTPQATERLQIVRGFLAYAKKKGIIEINLAQHVRIRKSKSRIRKTLSAEIQTIELTADGHAQLVAQLEKLKSERAPLAVQIQRAAADKDVRENAPLEAAREQLGHVESRIRDIEATLKNAVIVDSSSSRKSQLVKIGARVSVKDLDSGRQTTYTLVSRTEANSLEGRISDVSPLGKALIGRSPGDEVEVETPRGKIRYSITKVS
jgi:transcription elongation factor GreA